MRSPVVLCLLLAIVYEAQCSYVAIAPKVFHPGWKYAVQLTVVNAPNNGVRMSVTGNIFNGKRRSLGAGIVTFENGQSAMLEIQVAASIQKDPNNDYSLQLDGSGAMDFSNSTPLQMASFSRLAFIQTDKTVYSTEQLIRFRVVIVDEDLRPLYIPKNISIMARPDWSSENPQESTVARFYCNGSQAVYENTYQLAEFPELGNWYIAVQSLEGNIDEKVKIRVVENVTSNFDVSAEVTPNLLIKESGDNRYVTVKVTAREMNGQGVKGDIKVTVLGYNRHFRDRISEASGQRSMEVDLSRELAASKDKLTLLVEVKDSAGRQCSAKVSLCVKERPVSVHFDPLRTDHVYRTGMPFLAQLRIEDARGQALDQDDLANEVVMTLADHSNNSNTVTRRVTLSQGQKDIVWNLTSINSTTPQLQLTASFMVKGRKYEASETIKKYRVLGNGTLNVRWIGLAPNLTMGGMASFVVDVCNATNFTAVTYMILSRGNIQSFGRAAPGQRVNVKVTPHMCPKGRLVVYGLTEVASTADTPELIADSLYLTTEHCQGKRVNPKLKSNNLEAGSNVALGLDVEWTDPEKQQTTAVDHHDVFVMAVDKRSITMHGQYDVNPGRVEEGLDRFVVNTTQRRSEGQGRRKRSLHTGHTHTHPPATSTGDLLESLGLKLLGDVRLLAADPNSQQVAPAENSDDSQLAMSDRTFFPDTWLWKTSRTDDRGKLTLVETLPSCVTSWVVTAFAVRRDTELAITSEPLELDVFNKFYVRLNLPCTVRRGEKVEVRATVFNYDLINMDTTVTLAPSDNYIISGGSSETLMVKRNQAGSVTFMIVADKVGQFNIQVTATARRSNGATVTDTAERQMTVKSAGVVRKKIFTFPVVLSETRQPFDKNVSLDFSPWSKKDVIGSSTTVQVMVTGDLMGNVLNYLERLVMIPTGCGEQNLLSMVPSIHALTYLTDTDLLHLDFVDRAKDYIRQGYTRQVQQYRWKNGGYSAFGTKDQAASTWLTAFVLKTFAQARVHVLDCVDIDVVNSAVDFLYTRQNMGTGEFTERGRVLQEEMLERNGGTEALSVFVTISLLEAKKRGIKIKDDNMNQAINYVERVSTGQSVRENSFLAAMTAYALALHDHKTTENSVVRLLGYAETKGAPWRRKGVTTDNPQQAKYTDKPSPLDVQVTAYFLLTLNANSKMTKAKELLMWLIRNQNCKGGYRSTQDTMIAVQAIAEHAVNFERAPSYNDVVVTALSPSAKPRSVHIDSTNAAILQTVELPSQTSKLNIYVTGDANTLAVVKVLLTFHTNPDTGEKAYKMHNNNQLSVVTKTNMERAGLHRIQACIKPGSGLQYRSMVVLCLTLPSGFVPKDLRETRTENPVAVRVEGKRNQVRFYMYQPQRECINLKIEEKVKIDELKPGFAALFAYYMPDTRSEADIHIGCPDGSCSCTSKDCESSRASTGTQLNLMLVIAGFGTIFSLVFAR